MYPVPTLSSRRLLNVATPLFGDTDTANVQLDAAGGYSVTRQRRGDTTDVMLDYVGYDLAELRAAYKAKVDAANLPPAEAAMMLVDLETGLTGYTYLHEENASGDRA